MKLLYKGDIVKLKNDFCKVIHPYQYDMNFIPMVLLEHKGSFGAVPARSVKWNGKQWIAEVDCYDK